MAIINITPLTDITALIASDNVSEGDALLLEDGIYYQTVIIPKNNIRIIAKGTEVIFDGKSTLTAAFTLSNVTGVLIKGINIRHYRANGIVIEGGYGNRIIKNTINNMLDSGIVMINSRGNLIWKNEICRCGNGIILSLESTSNWIIDNIAEECSDDGFESVSGTENNNAFIYNKAIRNCVSGFGIFGNNNLVLGNLLTDNGNGLVISTESDSVAIGNIIKGCKSNTHEAVGYKNHFAEDNHIECNRLAGIIDRGESGTFLNNEISYNGNSGISLSFNINLVMDNILVCNTPENIIDNGTDNNLINNIEKPCEPCEAPSTVCGDCADKAD